MNRAHPLPAEMYALVEQAPGSVLLESARPSHSANLRADRQQLSRLFLQPSRVLIAHQLADLPALFTEIESAVAAGNYATGFFAYECASFFEPTVHLPSRQATQPLAWFGIYPQCHVFDHRTGTFIDAGPPPLTSIPHAEPVQSLPIDATPVATVEITQPAYTQRIAEVHEWIRAGDVYQLNFTFPLRIGSAASPAALYAHLGHRQPVEYAAFLHTQRGHHILSFSPELFFRIEETDGSQHITTRPMKGTAPRGRTTLEDQAQAAWLRNDVKNRSENLMIVDLLRNDLGRICRFGSVCVENLFAVERYETLLQMTSTVTGTLRPEINFQQIFRALFPCGSVTGAPKVRAMQLLAGLEPQPRGLYTGAIGFFSPQQTVFSVAIRTVELDGGQGKMGVGSGIVIDSDAASEFDECKLKAEFFTRSAQSIPEDFELVESMLWEGGYPLLALHLDRLADSADYFGFDCDRTAVEAALLAAAGAFADGQSRKIRLLLSRNGVVEIADETLPVGADSAQPLRVRIAQQRTDSSDRMLFHKTTHRPIYAKAFKAAAGEGFADVLFLNEKGEVTEGAISNLFIEKDGRWFTPPVECGLLPGVYRRHLLATWKDLEERLLSLQDLRGADGVYLANAVRGLRKVVIHWEA